MPLSKEEVSLKYGFRSGLEETIAESLTKRGVIFAFEGIKLKYQQPAKARTYLADFWLPFKSDPGRGFFIETKGRWLTEDRAKHLHIRASNPGVDIRFVFSNARQKISKQSATTYAAYCDRQGWVHAHREVPMSWLLELGYAIDLK